MTRASDSSLGRGSDALEVEARLLEANRRVGEAERAAAALRRRAEAAELRVAEARGRVATERTGREEALAEVTALLDAERRRGAELADSLQDELAEARTRLSEAESTLLEEREERAVSEEEFTAVAHARLAAALSERDDLEQRLSADLEERDGDVRVLGRQLGELRSRAAGLELERDDLEERLRLAQAAHAALEHEHADLGRRLEAEQAAVRDAVERVEAATLTARRQAEDGKTRLEEIQRQLAGELQRREQLLLALRDAEHRAAESDRVQAQLELRERELAAAQAEARGAGDATAKLQADLAVLRHRLEQSREELQAERIGRGTAEAVLEKAREDHQVATRTAEAVLTRERDAHEAALKHFEGRAQAALDAERSAFARERDDLDARVQRAVAEAAATMAGERSARQQERTAIAGSLGSLRTDIESTIGALREKLEGEITRTRALTGALEQRHASLATENAALREARAGVEQALHTSEERAAALDAELVHRRDLMDRVGTATVELRGHLDETRRALQAETRRRESTEVAAREVIAAAQHVLLTRPDEEPPGAEAEAYAANEPLGDADDPLLDASEPATDAPEDESPTSTPATTGATPLRLHVVGAPEAAEAPATPSPAEEESIDELSLRFEQIRAQLAERGVRSARMPAERTPGGPR